MSSDPIWVLESSVGQGWKVVWCRGKPHGGRNQESRNWDIIQDGMTWSAAVAFAKRLRGPAETGANR